MRNRSENQVTLVLIRHGATKANQEQRYLGKKTDEALSEEGIRALVEYKTKREYPLVDCLYASPMKRCMQTAKILYPNLVPKEIKEWVEMDFGTFEGKNYIELKDDKQYQAWIDSNGTLPFPEGESREEFIARCDKGFRGMLQELVKEKDAKQSKTIGMIVHGGTIMALLSCHYGGDYFDYQVKNGKGYSCTITIWNDKTEITELRKI